MYNRIDYYYMNRILAFNCEILIVPALLKGNVN